MQTYENRSLVYQGQSLDEFCLLNMAQAVGTFDYFMERDISNLRLGKYAGSAGQVKLNNLIDGQDNSPAHSSVPRLQEYKILKSFKFTSERKCSSIVVRAPDGLNYVYVKGSELAIKGMLREGQEAALKAVEADEEEFARTGLRTLYFGYKVL